MRDHWNANLQKTIECELKVFPQDTRTSIRGSMRAGNVSEGLSWREYQIVESIRVSQGYWLMQELDSWVPVELVVDASIGAEQRAT